MALNKCQAQEWLARLLLLIGLGSLSVVRADGKSYVFQGAQAPYIKTNPLAQNLQQKLDNYQNELRRRSTRVNLKESVEQSLLNNPELAKAYALIQQSQWSLIAIRRQRYPTLSAEGGAPTGGFLSYSGSRTRTTLKNLGSTSDSFQERLSKGAALRLGWTFFDPSRSPQINAASEALRSQELLFDVTARNLVLDTQLAYFSLQQKVQLIRSYERILDATTNQVKRVEALFNVGNASIADVEQTRTQQFQTLSLLINTYQNLIEAAARLAEALALEPGQLALPTDEIQSYGRWELPLEITISNALMLREEIQSSLAQSYSANWTASALLNRYWPRFGVAATGRYAENTGRDINFITSDSIISRNSNWDGAVGIGFNWSVFDGGIAAAEAAAQKALARQQVEQAKIQRLQISAEVERTYAAYQASLINLQSTSEQVRSAERAEIAVRERFSVGYADSTTVVQTLNQSITAANNFATAIRDYNSAVAGLYRASAQWPDSTLSQVNHRVERLKKL